MREVEADTVVPSTSLEKPLSASSVDPALIPCRALFWCR